MQNIFWKPIHIYSTASNPETKSNYMIDKIIRAVILSALFLSLPFSSVSAQDQTPNDPVYIVQSGDNLTAIAVKFGISSKELVSANNISDPNALKVGDQLVIPGLEGVSGFLSTVSVPFGTNIASLSREYNVSESMLVKLNHITSPSELYAGFSMIIPQPAGDTKPVAHTALFEGESPLELAAKSNLTPWELAVSNNLDAAWQILPQESLFYAGDENTVSTSTISSQITDIKINPLPLVQGKTTVITIKTRQPVTLTGSITDYELHFFKSGENEYTALQGIYAMQEPGLYPLTLKGDFEDGQKLDFQQSVYIKSGDYPKDPPLYVQDEFVDPAITQPELDWMKQTVSPASADKLWDGEFLSPSPYSYLECLNSRFGNIRSFNGGPYNTFHSGVDFCGGEGVQITAPAEGKVIFAGPLTVRGNATIIDHGWGVYSGIYHQSAISVQVGQMVKAGDPIGLVGGTGRVTGAHLHWEIWVNGVQVDPIDWLENTYP
jgi:murein DD-endopeptidase MepM/ murein hydrolase activator NlpD